MKIALCLSGQPRGLPISFEHIKKNIIVPNDIQDVFFHAWHNERDVGKPYDSAQPNQNAQVGIVKAKTKEILTWAYNPKKAIVESQREFLHLRELKQEPSAVQEILGSNFYSSYMSNLLRQEFEIETGEKYDVIIKSRFDLFFRHPIIITDYLSEIEKGKIIIRKKYQDDQDAKQNVNRPMNDVFAVGKREVMDVFCGVYPEMTVLNKIIDPAFGENYLGQHVCVNNNVELFKADWDFEILHRIVDLRG